MPFDAHANFAVTTVAVAPSPATSGTSLTVAAGKGAVYPAVPFNASVGAANVSVVVFAETAEIVRVTKVTGDVLTLERAAEGPNPARAIVAGDVIANAITAKTLTDVEAQTQSTWKKPVRVASAIVNGVGLPECTASGAGPTGTLEANAAGALTVDGVLVAVGDRVLVKDIPPGVTAANLGIYEVIHAGGVAEKWKLTRTADANTGPQLENAMVFARNGTAGAAIPFTCSTTTSPIVVDTTELTWVEAGDVTLGTAQRFTGAKNFAGPIGAEGGVSALQGQGLLQGLEIDSETVAALEGMVQMLAFQPPELTTNPNDYHPLGALPVQGGNLTLGSKIVTGLASTALLAAGAEHGVAATKGFLPEVPLGTTIKAILSETSIELNLPALKSGEGIPLTFYPVSVYKLKASKPITFTSWAPHPSGAKQRGQLLIVQNISASNFIFVHDAKPATIKGAINGTKEVTGLTEAEKKLYVGEKVTGSGIPANTTVAAILSETAVELSNAATKTEEPNLTFTPGTTANRFKFSNAEVIAAGHVTVPPGGEIAFRYAREEVEANSRWRGSYLSNI